MALDDFRKIDMQINRANDYQLETQFAKEGDYNGRELVVQITNAGEVSNQTGVSLNLGWHHDDAGNSGLDPFTVVDASNGVFKITYPTEMLIAGDVTATIQVVESGRITLTRNFKITVEQSPINEDTIVSENSFTILQDALITVNEYDGRISKVENKLNNLSFNDIDKSLGKLDGTYFSDSFLSQLSNGTINTTYLLDGSVTNTKVADKAINRQKLADNYNQNGTITEGDLTNYALPGSYQVSYSSNISGLPTNFKQSGHLFNMKSAGGWVIQLLSTVLGDPKLYYRTMRSDVGGISQVKDWILLNPATIDRDRLSDSFMSDGIFLDNSTDLNTLYRDGLYVALSSVLNRPSDLDTTFFLEIKSYKNSADSTARWVVQDIYRFSDHEHLYTRRLDAEQAPKEWTKVDDNKLSTELNSKLKITQDRITELSERNHFKYAPFDKAYITIVWDDGRHDLDKVQEVYKDYPNIPMSLAIPSNVLIANNTLDGTTAAPKLQTVVNEILTDPKNELLGHGKTGGAITANRTAEWVDDELGLAQVDYTNLGYDVKGMMLSGATDPQGVYSASNYDDVGYGYIAKRYYAYGDNLAYDEPYNTKRTSVKSMADMQNIINDAIENKKWIAFFAHTMDGREVNNTEENHRALLDYILGLEGIEFTTYRNMYEKFGSTELEQRLEKLEI